MNTNPCDAVALIPAAGTASRLGQFPFSKELAPLPHRMVNGELCLRTPLEYALEEVAAAGVECAYVLIRREKWDIADYLARRGATRPRVAFLVLDQTRSLVETLLAAVPFTAERPVVLALPDLLYSPKGAMNRLVDRLCHGSSDLVLGTFATSQPENSDVVQAGEDGIVLELQVKHRRPSGNLAWAMAGWRPSLWPHLRSSHDSSSDLDSELHLGHAFQAAMKAGCTAESVRFKNGRFTDLGTPAALFAALENSQI